MTILRSQSSCYWRWWLDNWRDREDILSAIKYLVILVSYLQWIESSEGNIDQILAIIFDNRIHLFSIKINKLKTQCRIYWLEGCKKFCLICLRSTCSPISFNFFTFQTLYSSVDFSSHSMKCYQSVWGWCHQFLNEIQVWTVLSPQSCSDICWRPRHNQ